MIPYRVNLMLNKETNEHLFFETNEKPFKGDLFTIRESDGKQSEFRITEVTKVIIRSKDDISALEYQCVVEKHETKGAAIGFK